MSVFKVAGMVSMLMSFSLCTVLPLFLGPELFPSCPGWKAGVQAPRALSRVPAGMAHGSSVLRFVFQGGRGDSPDLPPGGQLLLVC